MTTSVHGHLTAGVQYVRSTPTRIQTGLEEHNRIRADVRARRAEAVIERRIRGESAVKNLADRAEESAETFFTELGRKIKSGTTTAVLFIPRKVTVLAIGLTDRVRVGFPVSLKEKAPQDAAPAFIERWRPLALLTASGAALWVISVIIVHGRWTVWGLVVGVVIGVGFARSLDWKFSVTTGTLAVLATVVAIVVGELIVILLYWTRLYTNIGVSASMMVRSAEKLRFFLDYVWWFVIGILLPSVAVAFLIAAWPFPKRFTWKERRSRS
jgi:hypothetical protein